MSSSLAGNNPRVNSMFSQMMDITKDPEFKNASPDVQQMLLFGGVLGSQPSQIPAQEELDRMGRFQQEQARAAQQLGKESLWQTGAAYALFKGIPQTITSAFARTAEANREAGYAIPRAYADTFRALSRGPY